MMDHSLYITIRGLFRFWGGSIDTVSGVHSLVSMEGVGFDAIKKDMIPP